MQYRNGQPLSFNISERVDSGNHRTGTGNYGSEHEETEYVRKLKAEVELREAEANAERLDMSHKIIEDVFQYIQQMRTCSVGDISRCFRVSLYRARCICNLLARHKKIRVQNLRRGIIMVIA